MKERDKCKKKTWAITDLNAPNGSRDIPSQSQEFEQDGRRHFVGFQPHFHVNMTSQMQLILVAIAAKFEIKRNSFAKF